MSVGAGFSTEGYGALLLGLLITRGADLWSTYLATPTLTLEANPLARRLGWRAGLVLNLLLCLLLPLWPLPAIMLITSSALVAARNFQNAWLIRAIGERPYRTWMTDRLAEAGVPLFVMCLAAQTVLVGGVGMTVMWFCTDRMGGFAVGAGIVVYAVAVAGFTGSSVFKIYRRQGHRF